mmetsp:Transcript_24848/g.48619  ORF Transcript_24848/g.48619 Transcript_24848/m.48619 type:complete len:361 (-) Transcript_24848:284-1366(-)
MGQSATRMPECSRSSLAVTADVMVGVSQIPTKKDEDRFSMEFGSLTDGTTREFRGCDNHLPGEVMCLGVYDGHGGPEVSEMLKKRMHKEIIASASTSSSEDLREEQKEDRLDKTSDKIKIQGKRELMVSEETISQAYHDLDISAKDKHDWCGSTATNVFISTCPDGSKLVRVSWTGDCRVAMFQGSKWNRGEYVTFDHDLSRDDEKARVLRHGKEHGGTFVSRRIDKRGNAVGAWAVFSEEPKHKGLSLNMTRSIGDKHCSSAVIADPEFTTFRIPKHEKARLVVASDGIWKVLEYKSVRKVMSKSVTPMEAANALAAKALRRTERAYHLTRDDITVMIIDIGCSRPLDQTFRGPTETPL